MRPVSVLLRAEILHVLMVVPHEDLSPRRRRLRRAGGHDDGNADRCGEADSRHGTP
jgi:hypothetical protein